MALDDYKIAAGDYTGKDVSGLANKPTLTAAQLKARFDSLVKNVVAVKYNACIDALKTLIAGLASKVTGATNGNFAGLDADGQLTDSGKKPADFAAAAHVSDTNNPHSVTAAQVVTGKEISPLCVEFSGMEGNGGYLDFHFEGSSADFTSRIIEEASGVLRINAALNLSPALTVANGGTGATTAADARTALGLGNSATKDVGTGSTQVSAGNHTHTAADVGAATAGHTHTRSSLGFITAAGEVTVPANTQYADITVSGATTSKMIFINNNDAVVSGSPYVVSARITANNTVRLYINTTRSSSTTVGYQVLIVG